MKYEPFTVGDLDKALKEFKFMSLAFNMNSKGPWELIEGPLSFVAGDLTVVVYKTDQSH